MEDKNRLRIVDGKKPLDQLRFEDEDLSTLHKYVVEHIQECNDDKRALNMQFERLVMAQEENTRSVRELTDETRGVVQLHRDIQGAARIGTTLQNFAIWLAKWGAVGAAAAAAVTIFTDFLGKP